MAGLVAPFGRPTDWRTQDRQVNRLELIWRGREAPTACLGGGAAAGRRRKRLEIVEKTCAIFDLTLLCSSLVRGQFEVPAGGQISPTPRDEFSV